MDQASEGDETHSASGFYRHLLTAEDWRDLGLLGSIPGSGGSVL